MKTARATLASAIGLMLALSLPTSETLAGAVPIDSYDKSSNEVFPEVGLLKAPGDCPLGTTFIKNAFPSLTNGQEGGTKQETFPIALGAVTLPVTVQITWLGDNSFGFNILNGLADIVGVTSDTNTFLYKYANQQGEFVPVDEDALLNKLKDGSTAADVNHLDLCLEAVDTEGPSVQITSPVNTDPAATVSGTVIVTATVRDFVEVGSVTATVEGVGSLAPVGTPECSRDAEGYEVCNFEWHWFSTTSADGPYTITIVATDTSGNETTDSVSVSLENAVSACVGVIGPDDPSQNEGCNPSGVQNVQVPPDNNLEFCTPNDPNDVECSITEFLVTPADPPPPATVFVDPGVVGVCSGQYAFADPRVDANGVPQDFRSLDVFLELGGGTAGQLIMDSFTFGNPCFAVVKGARNFELTSGFYWPVNPATGLVVIRTQFAEDVPGGLGPLTQCYDETANPDLQQAGEFTYQRDLVGDMIEGASAVLTNACFNPLRSSTPDFSFSILNSKEHGGIDFFLSPTGPDDVLEFKFQRADAKFDALGIALDQAQIYLTSPKFSELSRLFNQARSQFDKRNSGSLSRALEDLDALLLKVQTGTWTVNEARPTNLPGEVQQRTENLYWRVLLLKRALENANFPVN